MISVVVVGRVAEQTAWMENVAHIMKPKRMAEARLFPQQKNPKGLLFHEYEACACGRVRVTIWTM